VSTETSSPVEPPVATYPEPKPGKESVFLRIPHGMADAIRDAIDSENRERKRRKREPLFMRGSKHNLIRWVMRAGKRELLRVERGPRGRQIASPPEAPKDPVTRPHSARHRRIARSMEIDAATAERIRVAIHVINRRRAALGKAPVCVYVGHPSVAAFYLRSAERELRRLARETEKKAAKGGAS
jgi:hypothetical protein